MYVMTESKSFTIFPVPEKSKANIFTLCLASGSYAFCISSVVTIGVCVTTIFMDDFLVINELQKIIVSPFGIFICFQLI